MAYTVKGEYQRLLKLKAEREKKSDWKRFSFECGCACGYVTRIEYIPSRIYPYEYERVEIYGIAGWSNEERLFFEITEKDVERAYKNRKYKYWKEFGILEYFPSRDY